VNALQTAAGIVVSSRSTAGELEAFAQEERLPLPPLTVAPLAGANLGSRASPEQGDPPYFLCLGTIEERKNHRLLLEVWLRLIAESGSDTPRLVILGQWGARSSAVREMLKRHPALRRYVTLITRCSDSDLSGWVAGAQALLMPTLAEGFGLPMVEALAMGTPVIASDLPSFRETGQGIPCLLDPANAAAWTRAIAGFSDPGGERQRQLQLIGRYRPAVWEDHFAGVEDWLATLPRWSDQTAMATNRMAPCQMEGSPLAVTPMKRAAGAKGALSEQLFRTIEARP
jgi:glycosyltransferase involved in cell wall biosynthesis